VILAVVFPGMNSGILP